MSKVTIYTLAKELNMTPSMVSRAFNPAARISEEKRRTVLAAAERYGFSPNKMASRLSMRTVRIGVLINSHFSVNTEKMKAGIARAHEQLRDYKIAYDITLLNEEEHTYEDFRRALAAYRDYDGVILSGMSASDYTPLIDELYRVNPCVVQVQAINEAAGHLFASKHDERTASAMAAEFLYHCLRRAKEKRVLLFTGDLRSTLHTSARQAFAEACERLGLTLLSSVDMKDSEKTLEGLLPEVFGSYGDTLDGIYITSGVSAPLCRYLAENGYDIPLVTFDTYEEIKQYMKKGVISATVAQNVAGQMERAFSLLVKHLITGERCPKTVYTDLQLVLQSNSHQFD